MLFALRKNRMYFDFNLKLNNTLQHVIFIQSHFKNIKTIMEERMLVLRNSILESHKMLFVNALLQRKEDPYYVELGLEIQRMSNIKKDFITDCFVALAKLDFRLMFLKWFLVHRLDPGEEEEKYEELVENINVIQKQIFNITDFVAGNDPETRILLRGIGQGNKKRKRSNMDIHMSIKSNILDQYSFFKNIQSFIERRRTAI